MSDGSRDIATPVEFRHEDTSVVLHPLPFCRVSRFVAEHRSFYELEFLERLATLVPPERVAIDGGAHIGNHTVFLSKVCGLRVVAFEPNPAAFAALEATIADNGLHSRVVTIPIGLSDRERTARLRPMHQQDPGTMAVTDEAVDGVAVSLRRLDDVWRELTESEIARHGVGLLKLDVEGHEVPALHGAEGLLHDHRPIVTTEVHSLHDLDAVDAVLAPLGYRPASVYNPTPTVLWWPGPDLQVATSLVADAVRYAVRAGSAANASAAGRASSDREEHRPK